MGAARKLTHAKDAGFSSGNRQKCLEGTREDILKAIISWALDLENRRVYWLNGSAGTGKSTICRSFAKYCSVHVSSERASFARGVTRTIFPALTLDLAYNYPAFRAALLENHSERGKPIPLAPPGEPLDEVQRDLHNHRHRPPKFS
jgi:hypothetical protein